MKSPKENRMAESVGKRIASRLSEFSDALKKKDVISEQFTCRRVTLDLCPTPYDPEMVKETRRILGASQALFAQFLGVSVKTVRSWEQGIDTPTDMACRFMDEIRFKPKYWLARFRGVVVKKPKGNAVSQAC